MYEDKILVCKECGNEFTFTAGEQEFYAERGFQNEPQRCKACRDARKNAARGPREYFTAVCAACGGEARVPFEPKSDRPVYCSECFAKMREQQADCQLIQRAPQAGALFVCLRGTIGKRKGATAGCADSSPGWWPRNRPSGSINSRKEGSGP